MPDSDNQGGKPMKRLVIFCDGTWNKPDCEEDGVPTPSNVVRSAIHIAKYDGDIPQVIFYDLGVGCGNWFDRIVGGAFGDGLEENIHDAYRFLIANYSLGDEIYLFGFSRGAFTARSIGGMVRKCGILRRNASHMYIEATRFYRNEFAPGSPQATAFRRQYSIAGEADIDIRFVGVWDTVGSLGIPKDGGVAEQYKFHDTELSGCVRNAFHAVAIDEQRRPFQPALWSYKPKPGQTVQQMWFAGVHSDVGGGYASEQAALIPLQWILEKAAETGLKLDEEAQAAYPMPQNPTAPLHESRKGIYKLQSGVHRVIGRVKQPFDSTYLDEDDLTQDIHPSVLVRWDSDASYRPPGLRDYFKRKGDPRGDRP